MENATLPAPTGRVQWIDALKGFASLTVVLGHVLGCYIDWSLYAPQREAMALICSAIYSFHMPLFFMISGFVFSTAYLQQDRELKRQKVKSRIVNLVILYFLWSILYGCVFGLFSYDGGLLRFLPGQIVPLLKKILWLPLKSDPPCWYLYTLALCHVLTILIWECRRIGFILAAGVCLYAACAKSPEIELAANFLPSYYLFFCRRHVFAAK